MRYILVTMLALSLISCAGKQKKAEVSENERSENQTVSVEQPEPPQKKNGKSKRKGKFSGDENAVACSYENFKREISVENDRTGCRVQYVRDSETSQIGSGHSGSPFCPNLLKRVQNNLETAGFQCK